MPSPGNVWMKDSWNDSGAEPDPGQTGADMWKSPYIWVRNSEDSAPDYPAQHLDQSPIPGQVNYVYAKLQNDGDGTEGKLGNYGMAEGATTLVWQDFAMVDSVPGLRPSCTLHTDPTSIQMDPVRWWTIQFARTLGIERRSRPHTRSVERLMPYVRGSNNVVWRSLSVVTLAPGTESAPLEVAVDNLVQNRSVNSLVMKTSDANPAHSFFRYGEIVVQLDKGLLAAWERTGYQGRGFERSGNRLRITDPNGAVLDRFDAGSRRQREIADAVPARARRTYWRKISY